VQTTSVKTTAAQALLVVSFGGPEGPADVLPFLENVLRGRNVPRERMLEVASHYEQFGGVSPINGQNRQLIESLQVEFREHGIGLPIYFGNRNWHPLLEDTIRQMAADGVRQALAFFTSAYSSYSGCRQYRENIAQARVAVGATAPEIHKLRAFFNHPGFIEALADLVRLTLRGIPTGPREAAAVFFTAHSIPQAMAATCQYERQLRESCRLVAAQAGLSDWQLVFQSRSGPPQQPWLEPDICDAIRARHEKTPLQQVLVIPIGFVSDHLEVVYDLDTQAAEQCARLGIGYARASTVGTHPRFVQMIRELVSERLTEAPVRPALGDLGPCPDICPVDCCKYEPRPAARTGAPSS